MGITVNNYAKKSNLPVGQDPDRDGAWCHAEDPMGGSVLDPPHLLPGLLPTCTGRNVGHAPLTQGAVVGVSSIPLHHVASLSSLQV